MKDIEVSIDGSNRNKGKFFLIYGVTNTGKTTSSLATLPDPILHILAEPRAVEPMVDPIGRIIGKDGVWTVVDVGGVEKRMRFMNPGKWDEQQEFLAEEAGKPELPYKSLLYDGSSYMMNFIISEEIETETLDAGIWDAKNSEGRRIGPTKRRLVDSTRKDLSGFGAAAKLMLRTFRLLGAISQKGVVVVATALLDDDGIDKQPEFIGKMFGNNFPGMVDCIGMVSDRYVDGAVVYPPLVRFEKTEDENFLTKWTGKHDKKLVGPLHWGKILSL